jgi:hypothetical protein
MREDRLSGVQVGLILSEEQSSNACSAIDESFDGRWTITSARLVQHLKAAQPIVWTEAGMQIDRNDEQK